MNRRSILIAGIIVAIAGGMAYLLLSSDAEKATQDMIAESGDTAVGDMPAATQQSKNGKYVDYSENIIAQTSGTKLLFFHAPWCPQCRALEADIKKSGIPDGTTIIKIDYDSNQSLRRKYGVTIQTTIVLVNDQGDEVSKYVAYDTPTVSAVEMNLFSR